jgi:HK97 family phage major capsid protein/HK97 family phage prohead protease
VGVSTPAQFHRAYAVLDAKAVKDGEARIIRGIASTPEVDRVGDIVEPKGATFASAIPLLLHHDSRLPVGTVKLNRSTDAGITFEAQLPDITNAGTLRDRIEEAWDSVKAGLIRGVSIGFRALEDGVEVMKNGGLRFKAIEIVELSLVAIPANASASIQSIKSFDLSPADAGGSVRQPTAAAVAISRGPVSASPPKSTAMKTVQEQKAAFAQTRDDKAVQMKALMDGAAEKNVTLDGEEAERYDALAAEIQSIDAHLKRLDALESANIGKAVAVATATGTEPAAAVRGGVTNVVQVNEVLPKGVGFARAVQVKAVSRLDHRNVMEVAKEMFPGDARLHAHLKAAVPAGTSTQTVWAGPLVDQTNLASEFIEYLRPATIIGKLTQVRRVPFNVRMVEQTGGGNGYWVGEGAPKPLTSFSFQAITMAYTKVAAISVITQELARFSSPSADMLVRDSLRDALVERIDIDFIDPAEAGTTNVQPASITNGLTALTSAGTSADNARTDLANIVSSFVEANLNTEGLVIIMPTTLALALSFQVNSLGQPEFPGLSMGGGTLNGIPVITSQYAANASGGGNLVIALNQRELFLADDGQVTVDASTEASLQMLDNPTNNSATGTPTTVVSMYQTNSIALRAERFINWRKRRSTAVVYMDDVNWGSIGSPA